MADRLKALGKAYEIHYAGQSAQTMALLQRLQKDHAGALHLYVRQAGTPRMHLPSITAGADAQTRIYACGPERLIDELEALAEHWPPGILRFEHFHAADPALDPSQEHSFTVHLQDSGLELTVPANQTLLQTLQAAGFDIPCDCGEGLCGTCEVSVLQGEPDHRDKVLTRAERAANTKLMACCSRAKGQRLVLAL